MREVEIEEGEWTVYDEEGEWTVYDEEGEWTVYDKEWAAHEEEIARDFMTCEKGRACVMHLS